MVWFGVVRAPTQSPSEVEFDDWDGDKAATNEEKHGVSFDEAMTCWLSEPETERRGYPVAGEERFVRIGWSTEGRKLMVVYCLRNGLVRIISARVVDR